MWRILREEREKRKAALEEGRVDEWRAWGMLREE